MWKEEAGAEHEDEYEELGKWYKEDTGYREVAGVGLAYSESVRQQQPHYQDRCMIVVIPLTPMIW